MDDNDRISRQRHIEQCAETLDAAYKSLDPGEDQAHARGRLEDSLAAARRALKVPSPLDGKTASVDYPGDAISGH